jgi:hypothetical protein
MAATRGFENLFICGCICLSYNGGHVIWFNIMWYYNNYKYLLVPYFHGYHLFQGYLCRLKINVFQQ